jgi:hypothetical protein
MVPMVRFLCKLIGGKRKEGMGFPQQGGVRTTCLQEKRGVWYEGKGRNREPTGVVGKEGRTMRGGWRVRRHAVATQARHMWAPPLTAFIEHAVTAT